MKPEIRTHISVHREKKYSHMSSNSRLICWFSGLQILFDFISTSVFRKIQKKQTIW